MLRSHTPSVPVERPWHREPIVWLVITLPLVAVIGAVTSAVLAARGADPEVADALGQPGAAIRQARIGDALAARPGVALELTTSDGTLTAHLSLPTAGGTVAPTSLVAVFSQATGAAPDQRVNLEPNGTGSYTARLPPLAPGHWSIEITPSDHSWRLTGDFIDAPGSLTLRARPAS
jgi:hypothetical protein